MFDESVTRAIFGRLGWESFPFHEPILVITFAVVALLVLTDALVKWLATVVHSEALAALIVGAVFLAIGIGLALWGRSAMSLSTLTPTRTTRQVRQDARVLSERVSG